MPRAGSLSRVRVLLLTVMVCGVKPGHRPGPGVFAPRTRFRAPSMSSAFRGTGGGPRVEGICAMLGVGPQAKLVAALAVGGWLLAVVLAAARPAGDRARRRRGGAVEAGGLAAGRSTAAVNASGVFRSQRHLAHHLPATDLRSGPEPAGGRLVAGQTRHRQPRRRGPPPDHPTVKRRLKRIQYRPELVDGCLTATGLTLEG